MDVGKIPMAFFALTAELAAAGLEFPPDDDAVETFLLWDREPMTPPTTAPAITRRRTGTPILTQGLRPFFLIAGVMYPDSLWYVSGG